jgi:hypothetical protein
MYVNFAVVAKFTGLEVKSKKSTTLTSQQG